MAVTKLHPHYVVLLCSSTNVACTVMAHVHLYFVIYTCVFTAPIIVGYPVIHSLDFERHSRTLTCSSEGQSTKFQWNKDGVDLNETASRRRADSSVALYESRLVLNQSDTDIAGNYSCTVYNNIGTSSQTLSVIHNFMDLSENVANGILRHEVMFR